MLIRGLLTISALTKLSVRAFFGRKGLLDFGDLLLMLIVFIIAPPDRDKIPDAVYSLPANGWLVPTTVAFFGLFLFGRALAAVTGLDSVRGKRGISPGGAAQALSSIGRWQAMVLAVPFCLPNAFLEEMLFRGSLFNLFEQRMGVVWASILQAAAFAGIHALPAAIMRHGKGIVIYATVFPLLSGLILQRLALLSSSLAAPAIVHSLLNIAATWRSKLGDNEGIL